MKRWIAAALSLCLLCGCALSLSGCGSVHPVEQLRKNLDKEQNCQMVLSVDKIPLVGALTVTVQMDGNKRHCSSVLLAPEFYTETVDGVTYQYNKLLDGRWLKVVWNDRDDSGQYVRFMEKLKTIFVKENFQKVKGDGLTYRQKTSVSFDVLRDVTLVFEKDACTITANVDADGMLAGIKMVFNQFGKVSLTIPTDVINGKEGGAA